MIQSFGGHTPDTGRAAFVAQSATVLGQVVLERDSSVWYGAVLRADAGAITLGEGSNVQDGAICHCDPGGAVRIGRGVTVGHGAIVHGCTVEDGCLIGMGATLLNHCTIGRGSIVGAGALVPEGRQIPPYSLVVGVPGRVVRTLEPEGSQCRAAAQNAAQYILYARQHANLPPAK